MLSSVGKRLFSDRKTIVGLVLDVEDDFEVRLVWRTLDSCQGDGFWYCSDARFPDFGQLVEISMSGSNQTQQRIDTSIAIRSLLMFPPTRSRSVDDFCRLSPLQTRSNNLETLILFSVKFRFPDMNPQRGVNQPGIYI